MSIFDICDAHETSDKMMIIVDSIGVVMVIAMYGFGMRDFVHNVFPDVILVLTVISLSLTIVKKAYDIISNKKKED